LKGQELNYTLEMAFYLQLIYFFKNIRKWFNPGQTQYIKLDKHLISTNSILKDSFNAFSYNPWEIRKEVIVILQPVGLSEDILAD
jgi:hypothetical protein